MKPLLVLAIALVTFHLTVAQALVEVPIDELQPTGGIEYRVIGADDHNANNRRRLAPYELCLICKCCTATATTCLTMPCCFGIVCNLPNKPFGVCAFVPKTCICTSCTSP